jgi:AcrR family transcriptional regulator
MGMNKARPEKRSVNTRNALLSAFRDLIMDKLYDQLTVEDIVGRANVGRSTFYEHFAGKDGLLAASIAGPFSTLADTIGVNDNVPQLVALLEHFWAQRRLARELLVGAIRERSVRVLVGQIERRLRIEFDGRNTALILPTRLVAVQTAEMLLAPVAAWLTGESRCDATALAVALRRSTLAYLAAMKTCRP